jgi:hypothetical protein
VILLPRRQVEVGVCRNETSDGPPRETEVERAGREDDAEGGVEGVAAVIEEFSELQARVVSSQFGRRREERKRTGPLVPVLLACFPSIASKL